VRGPAGGGPVGGPAGRSLIMIMLGRRDRHRPGTANQYRNILRSFRLLQPPRKIRRTFFRHGGRKGSVLSVAVDSFSEEGAASSLDLREEGRCEKNPFALPGRLPEFPR